MESESWRKISEAYIEQIDSEKYCVLHDVTIHTEYGDTTQIDHIVIAETGVFVIETKTTKVGSVEMRNLQGGHRVF